MIPRLREMSTKIMDCWLPHYCLLCNKATAKRDICLDCYQDLPLLKHYCHYCGHQLPDNRHVCGDCLQRQHYHQRLYALLNYRSPVTQLIYALKFQNKLSTCKTLGGLMADHISLLDNACDFDVITPVPLHNQRLRQRGYNQALELARPIAKQLQLPIDNKLCRRVKATEAQTLITAKQRPANLRNAFRCQANQYQHALLVDDVVTTTSTIRECCKSLAQSGIKKINVLCCARTQLKV